MWVYGIGGAGGVSSGDADVEGGAIDEASGDNGVQVAVQVPLLLVAVTAAPPPNAEINGDAGDTTVVVAARRVVPGGGIVADLARAPPVPDAPEMLMAPFVTVGGGGVLMALAIVKLRNSKNAG